MKEDNVNFKLKEKKIKSNTVFVSSGTNIQKWLKMHKEQTNKDFEIHDTISYLISYKFLFDQSDPGSTKFNPRHYYGFYVCTFSFSSNSFSLLTTFSLLSNRVTILQVKVTPSTGVSTLIKKEMEVEMLSISP